MDKNQSRGARQDWRRMRFFGGGTMASIYTFIFLFFLSVMKDMKNAFLIMYFGHTYYIYLHIFVSYPDSYLVRNG